MATAAEVALEVSAYVRSQVYKIVDRVSLDDGLCYFVRRIHGKRQNTWCQQLSEDLRMCHANGCRLNWKKLQGDPDVFLQDICGIMYNLDRKTGQLKYGYRPESAY